MRAYAPIIVLGGVALLLALSVVRLPVAIAFAVPTTLGVGALLAIRSWAERGAEGLDSRRIARWMLGSFVAHLLFSIVVTHAGGIISDVLRGPDALYYNNAAVELNRHWSDGFPAPELPAGKEGYYYLLAGIYWLFGTHTIGGLAVNATLSAALVPLVTDTTRRLFGVRAAYFVPPIVVLLPGMFLWTIQLGKEAPVLFLIASGANAAVRLTKRLSLGPILALTASISLLFTFRGWVALTLAGGFLGGIALSRREFLAGIGSGLSVAIAIAMLILTTGIGYSGYEAAVNSDLDQASRIRRDLALAGRSGYDDDVDVSTPLRAVGYLPNGFMHLAFGPFPWEIRSVRQVSFLPEMLVWWMLVPSLWRGLRRGYKLHGRLLNIVVLPAVPTAILLILAVGNFGTQLRERLQLIVLLVPCIAFGLALRDRRGDPTAEAHREDAPTPRPMAMGPA